MRQRQIGERVKEVQVVPIDPVAQVRVQPVIERQGQRRPAGHRLQRDVGHVVGQPPAVGEAGEVAFDHAQGFRFS
jgi:hypothetical protein